MCQVDDDKDANASLSSATAQSNGAGSRGLDSSRKASNRPSRANAASLQNSTSPSAKRSLLRPLMVLIVLGTTLGVVAFRYIGTASEAPIALALLGNVDVRQVNLGFKVSGRIESMLVDEGDSVKAGDILATLDKAYFEDLLKVAKAQRDQAEANLNRLTNGSRPEEIEQAKAQVATAQAVLTRAKGDFERSKELLGKNAISPQEFDTNRALFLEAEASLKSAQASLQLLVIGPRKEDIAAGQAQFDSANAQVIVAKRQFSDAQLIAPHDGIILTRAREVGAIVNAGETVDTLTLSSPIWVRTFVGETDLGMIQPGMEVKVSTDTDRGREYSGRVGYISPTAEFTPKAVETKELRTSLVYRVRIVVDDPDGGLRQGMPVTVSVSFPGTRTRTVKERLVEALGLDRFQ